MKEGFRLGKCFQLYNDNITEIIGNLEEDQLTVCISDNKQYIYILQYIKVK